MNTSSLQIVAEDEIGRHELELLMQTTTNELKRALSMDAAPNHVQRLIEQGANLDRIPRVYSRLPLTKGVAAAACASGATVDAHFRLEQSLLRTETCVSKSGFILAFLEYSNAVENAPLPIQADSTPLDTYSHSVSRGFLPSIEALWVVLIDYYGTVPTIQGHAATAFAKLCAEHENAHMLAKVIGELKDTVTVERVNCSGRMCRGFTPLAAALLRDDPDGRFAVVQALLMVGADPNLGTGLLDMTVLHFAALAASYDNPHDANHACDVIKALKEAGADVSATDARGNVPAHFNQHAGDLDVMLCANNDGLRPCDTSLQRAVHAAESASRYHKAMQLKKQSLGGRVDGEADRASTIRLEEANAQLRSARNTVQLVNEIAAERALLDGQGRRKRKSSIFTIGSSSSSSSSSSLTPMELSP